MDEALQQKIAFFKELDKMKGIYRQNWILDKSRREDDAAHSWHCAMMAMLLLPYAKENVSLDRVIQMLLCHDIVEIYAGDTPCYDVEVVKSQAEREEMAFQKIMASLPIEDKNRYASLWLEFSKMETADARFATTIDRLQPLFLNYFTDGASWAHRTVTKAQVLKRNAICKETMPQIYEVVQEAVEELFQKGLLEE